jgi:putative transposase
MATCCSAPPPRPPTTAARRYAVLVAQGQDVVLWDEGLRQQIYLGDDAFVDRMQALAEPPAKATRDTPRAQRTPARPLAHWLGLCSSREDALYRAHTEGGLMMTAPAREAGLSVSRLSRLIAQAETALGLGL